MQFPKTLLLISPNVLFLILKKDYFPQEIQNVLSKITIFRITQIIIFFILNHQVLFISLMIIFQKFKIIQFVSILVHFSFKDVLFLNKLTELIKFISTIQQEIFIFISLKIQSVLQLDAFPIEFSTPKHPIFKNVPIVLAVKILKQKF